ncbi:MAG: RNA 3'-terminal phosphate cyclase [Planctomycetota bacterium]
MITIDGAQGEGGGQILRSALALALVTGQPFTITRIRARREKPGLLRQHLTAVQAAAAVGHAQVAGGQLGSPELTFTPGAVRPGDYHFAVGTAGSATLVLQTVLPALLCAPGPSTLRLAGGTHNPWAPPFDFLARCFLPLIGRMGPRVTATLIRPGFYPAGGGEFQVAITPAAALHPIELLARGATRQVTATAKIAHLPRHIAERELAHIAGALGLGGDQLRIEEFAGAHGPGNVVVIEIESGHVTEVFTGFGQRGVPAETVADQAAQQARHYLASDVPVGEYLTDQLLLPLALAGGGAFRTAGLSPHAQTNVQVIETFMGPVFEIGRDHPASVVVRARRPAAPPA